MSLWKRVGVSQSETFFFQKDYYLDPIKSSCRRHTYDTDEDVIPVMLLSDDEPRDRGQRLLNIISEGELYLSVRVLGHSSGKIGR